MPIADNGGFDVTIELNRAALAAAVAGTLSVPLARSTVSVGGIQADVTPVASIRDVELLGSDDVVAVIGIDGTTLQVTAVPSLPGPIAPWLGLITLAGHVRVTDHLEIRNFALIVDFSPDALRGQPGIVATLDEATLFSSPLMILYLAGTVLQGQGAYQAARAAILTTLQNSFEDAVRAALVGLGVVTLASPPGLPLAPRFAALRTRSQSLHLLYAVGGPAGDTNLISRSMLMTSGAGVPLDAVALDVSNACLLRDLLRPVLTARLALPTAGFLPGHPCFFVGAAPLTVPGGTPTGTAGVVVNSVVTGIDEAGLLHVVIRLTVLGIGGAFTYRATINAAMRMTATLSGRTLTVALAPAGTPVVTGSDIEIAWWVYAAAAFTGGSLLLSILATIDILGGLLLAGPVGAAVGAVIPTVPVSTPLPGRVPPLALRSTSLNQTDAARRTITLPGPVTIPDAFRSHDVILNFV
jgi:hypothetical protein